MNRHVGFKQISFSSVSVMHLGLQLRLPSLNTHMLIIDLMLDDYK